jgi:hypothetical protein
MTTLATVPVTVTSEAAARISALGLRRYVDRMIEYARQNLPGLSCIKVVLYDRHKLGDEPGLAIDVYSRQPFAWTVRIRRKLIRWMASTFPPDVLQHVILDYHPGDGQAG